MTQLYNNFARPELNDENNDYGQFWDTEDQRPICQTSLHITHDDEYEQYMTDYELTLTHQEHMLEYEYGNKYHPSVFSTVGFVLFIIKTLTGFIYK